ERTGPGARSRAMSGGDPIGAPLTVYSAGWSSKRASPKSATRGMTSASESSADSRSEPAPVDGAAAAAPSTGAGSERESADDSEAEVIPRVADFGLARLLDQPAEYTVSGAPIGSPPDMARERAPGPVRS